MSRAIGIGLVLVALFGCTDEDGAMRELRVHGYANVSLKGYEPFMCGKYENTCTGFTATAPNGERVTGAVGCGLWGCSKGCTLRLR